MIGDHMPWQSIDAWLLLVIAAGGIVLLVFGADRAVTAAARVAAALGMSEVIIGATVVSLGTTMPEACTSVTAAFRGEPGLAMGNAVGSIICDTGLVFGLGCLMTRLPLDRFILYRQGMLWVLGGTLLTVTLLLLALVRGSFRGVVMFRWIGVLYLFLLGGYLCVSVRWARRHPAMVPPEARAAAAGVPRPRHAPMDFAVMAVGLAMVVVGSDLLVGSAKELSVRCGVPPDVLAVTMVAFGTSLPELVTAITAVRKGHGEIMIGNVIGADILNVLFVVGASATAVPLAVDLNFFYLYLPAMMLVLGLMAAYIFTSGKSFRRWQGLPLLLMYAAFIALAVRLGALR